MYKNKQKRVQIITQTFAIQNPKISTVLLWHFGGPEERINGKMMKNSQLLII